jgi:ubiquinone/menaquinone biosynthesis C-methylase UbiE
MSGYQKNKKWQLNSTVREKLSEFIVDNYQLNPIGEEIVYKANENLKTDYVEHIDFPINDYWHNYFMERLMIVGRFKKEKALDVCAGSGTLCLNIQSKDIFKELIAIDINQFSIDRLSEKASEKRINVKPFCSNIDKTIFENETFDVIMGNSFLHHLPNNLVFLKEMYRILKKGGSLILTGEPSISADFLESFLVKKIRKYILFQKSNIENDPSDLWVYSEDDIKILFNQAGFKNVKIYAWGITGTFFSSIFNKIFGKYSRGKGHKFYWSFFNFIDKLLFFAFKKDRFAYFSIGAIKE